MKILVFGGTFDPPHIGHMSILKNAILASRPDKVMVIPSAYPPHKQASATPAKIRLAMCECFLPLFSPMEISDMEIARGGTSYTYDTIRQLLDQNPTAQIYLCIGSDMLKEFTTWHRYQELLKLVILVVQNRKQQDISLSRMAASLLESEGGRILFASGTIEDVSSSEIREGLQQGLPVLQLVPPPADEIIKTENLYFNAGN